MPPKFTDHERERITSRTLELIRQFSHKSQIKRQLKEEFGIEFREIEKHLSRARARLMEETQRTKEETHARITDKLEELIADPKVAARDKIKAIHELALINGLHSYSVRSERVAVGSMDELDQRRMRVAQAIEQLKASGELGELELPDQSEIGQPSQN